jgi:hypothetical protein
MLKGANAEGANPLEEANSMLKTVRNAAHLIADALREIFDESPYARFLARTGLPNSSTAYAEFLHQESHHRERRPRCC